MAWWEVQERVGYWWVCGVCGAKTKRPSPALEHRAGCAYFILGPDDPCAW